MSANVIHCHLANIMNNDISLNKFSNMLKQHVDTFSVKIYFRWPQVLLFKSYINSLNRKLEKNLRSEKNCRSGVMDLSIAFDFILHDLLIAKINAYCFLIDAVTLLYLYLKRPK